MSEALWGLAEQPRYVVDGLGNLWHYYSDTGYLRLQVTTDPACTLDEIVAETGRVAVLRSVTALDILSMSVRLSVQGNRRT